MLNFVRYADDFIVTGNNPEFLREQVLPVIKEFLSERGLQLSEEKTIITNIKDGFDFLGQNIRKYHGKLLIKPSKASKKACMKKNSTCHLNMRQTLKSQDSRKLSQKRTLSIKGGTGTLKQETVKEC